MPDSDRCAAEDSAYIFLSCFFYYCDIAIERMLNSANVFSLCCVIFGGWGVGGGESEWAYIQLLAFTKYHAVFVPLPSAKQR